MERIPNGRYTKEFREEAVKMVTDGGMSVLETSKRLSLPKSTLESWIRVSKTGPLGEIGKGQRPLTEIERELAKVKRAVPGQDGAGHLKKSGRGRQSGRSGEISVFPLTLLIMDVSGIPVPLPGAQFLSETFNNEHPGKRSRRQSFPMGNLFQLIGNLGFQP